MESYEDCLREATECDRLTQLANTQATRALLALAAFQWRKLADKAAERQKCPRPGRSRRPKPTPRRGRLLRRSSVPVKRLWRPSLGNWKLAACAPSQVGTFGS